MTQRRDSDKPTWPHRAETILTAAPNGQWCKKHKGKLHYFGPWDDPGGALSRWRELWPRITSGEPVAQIKAAAGTTVHALSVEFLNAKLDHVERGELSRRTYDKYRHYMRTVIKYLGRDTVVARLTPADLRGLANAIGGYSTTFRTDFIVAVRSLFKWGEQQEMIGRVRLGSGFSTPPAKARRAHKRKNRKTPYTAAQIRLLLARCRPRYLPDHVDADLLRAAIYLGINGGYGPSDLCDLTDAAIDLDAGVINYARKKTETERVVLLWPQTVRALRRVVSPGSGPVFVNSRGNLLVNGSTHTMSRWFLEALEAAGLKKTGLRFYDLRRTHATVAAQVPDKDARKLIMGHVMGEVLDDYVLHFPRPRLFAVTDHVLGWFLRGRPERPSPDRPREDVAEHGPAEPAISPAEAAKSPSRRHRPAAGSAHALA